MSGVLGVKTNADNPGQQAEVWIFCKIKPWLPVLKLGLRLRLFIKGSFIFPFAHFFKIIIKSKPGINEVGSLKYF